jgi:hypothetical protein
MPSARTHSLRLVAARVFTREQRDKPVAVLRSKAPARETEEPYVHARSADAHAALLSTHRIVRPFELG